MNVRELKRLEQKCTEFTQKRDAKLLKFLQEKLDKARKIAESFPLSKICKGTCSRKQSPEICRQLCDCNCVYGLALLIKSGYSISISEKIKYIITKGESMSSMEEEKNVTAVAVKERTERPEIVVVTERHDRARQLDTSIKLRVQVIGENLFEMCRELKEMRDDKLYQELGYQNFEEYCEEAVGITRRYAYEHISIYENLPEDFVKTSSQNGVSKNKLMLLSHTSESIRAQIMQEDPELKESYRKMQAHIKKLEEIRARRETEIKEMMEEIEQKDTMFADLRQRFDVLMDEKNELFEENIQLGEALEDARAQAGQNAVIEATYTDNADRINELESQLREQEEVHQREVRTLKEDYETKIEKAKSTAVRVPDYTETYLLLVQSTKEAVGMLKSFMKQHPELAGSAYDYFHMAFLTLANIEVQITGKNKKEN